MVDQLELFELKSPCVGDCRANAKGYCRSCLRNRNERQTWNSLDNTGKKNVIRLCLQRRRVLDQYFLNEQTSELTLPNQMEFDF